MGGFRIISRTISTHPLTRNHRLRAWMRVLKWQVGSSLSKSASVVPFIEHSRLYAKKGMHGATGNIYTGLQEFEDMAFLLHYMREHDIFYDIGANVGSYTILAAAIARCDVVAVEPIPSTFRWLKANCQLNDLGLSVRLVNKGVGEEAGMLRFTSSLDTVNHVISGESNEGIVVPIITLDQLVLEANKFPSMIKMDVEGFEMSVINGGNKTLSNNSVSALIIEINGCCKMYGTSEEEIHQCIVNFGFQPVIYEPFQRKIEIRESFTPNGNTIYLRNPEEARRKVQNGLAFRVLNKLI